jgi:Flp pilus assembly protein TadG
MRRRKGVLLILFGLLLVSLVGMLGVIIDGGILMSQNHHMQNAADAAALAAAHDLMFGRSNATAVATAQSYVTTHFGLTAPAAGSVRIPPTSGPFAGNSQYVEVVLQQNFNTYFAQVLPGVGTSQQLSVRSVAGVERIAAEEGVLTLNPSAVPGLSLSGQGTLRVNGRVLVNSEGGGVDQAGSTVPGSGVAAAAGNQQSAETGVYARDIRVVGGVDDPSMFKPYATGDPNPLFARQMSMPDPFVALPTPTTATGVDNRRRGTVRVNNNNTNNLTQEDSARQNFRAAGGESIANGLHIATAGEVILHPGIYDEIDITGGRVYFIPGIYVLRPVRNTISSIKLTGGIVVADGVMFYNTANTYDPLSGSPDVNDMKQVPPAPDASYSGDVSINAGMRFSPIDTSTYSYGTLYAGAVPVNSRFDGMLFYQRRRLTNDLTITGNSADGSLAGTLYAKWGDAQITGQGTYNAQFALGSMTITGQGVVTIQAVGNKVGRSGNVFLVE